MTTTAQAAATTAQQTREQAIQDALDAFWHDRQFIGGWMPLTVTSLTYESVQKSRTALTACLAHLDEIERHLPDSPRRGMLNDYYGGDDDE